MLVAFITALMFHSNPSGELAAIDRDITSSAPSAEEVARDTRSKIAVGALVGAGSSIGELLGFVGGALFTMPLAAIGETNQFPLTYQVWVLGIAGIAASCSVVGAIVSLAIFYDLREGIIVSCVTFIAAFLGTSVPFLIIGYIASSNAHDSLGANLGYIFLGGISGALGGLVSSAISSSMTAIYINSNDDK